MADQILSSSEDFKCVIICYSSKDTLTDGLLHYWVDVAVNISKSFDT